MVESKGSLLGGAFFIAGTTIGAGMLALPLKTGVAGFGPAVTINVISWLFMLATGLLYLEVTLWMPDMANLLSMARRFLGLPGQIVAGIGFLYLYYCLLVAYFSVGAPLMGHLFGGLENAWSYPLFALIFALIVYWGSHVADRLNFLLMGGLIISYVLLIGMGISEVKADYLTGANWALAFIAVPTVFAAYGYHNIVPTVSTYLYRDAHKLRLAIFIGTLIPLVIYSLWQFIVIGSLPEELIQEGLSTGVCVADPLEKACQNQWIGTIARYFSLFAIVTSVIGVALSMVDFLGDGTKIPRKGLGRFILVLIVFIPPLLFAWQSPSIFYTALHYAGVYGEAALNGLFPILMVWVGRYHYKLKSDWELPGGRITLSILLLMTLAVMGFEVVKLWL